MTGEHKFLVIVVSSALISVSVMILVALFIVWEQREWIVTIGAILLILFCLASIAVWIIRQFSEQHLRYSRVRYQEELPLDQEGQPYYIPGTMQPYAKTTRQRPRSKEQHAYHTVEEYQYRGQQRQGDTYR